MRVHHSVLHTARTALRIWSVIAIAATIPTIRLIAAVTHSTPATAVIIHLAIVIVDVIGKHTATLSHLLLGVLHLSYWTDGAISTFSYLF